MTSSRTVIFGNGEMAALNYYYLSEDSPYDPVAFTVDGAFVTETSLLGLPVVPFEEVARSFPPSNNAFSLVAGFRDVNRFRSERYRLVSALGYRLISYVSSRAMVSPIARLGDGVHVYEGAIIQPFAEIGNNVIVSPATMVGHHTVVGEHCFLSSRATLLGSATIGAHSIIGAAATVLDGVTVASDCIVGSGVVVSKNTKASEVLVGAGPETLPVTSDRFGPMLTWFNDTRPRG